MVRYFDLCNEQLRLIDERRVRPVTAAAWRSGIVEVISLSAFRSLWAEASHDLPDDFSTPLNELSVEKDLAPAAVDLPATPRTLD
jgi:hypothetical protein